MAVMPQRCDGSSSCLAGASPRRQPAASHQGFCSSRRCAEHLAERRRDMPSTEQEAVWLRHFRRLRVSIWIRCGWSRPTGHPPTRRVTAAMCPPRHLGGSTNPWWSPVRSTPSSSTCSAKVNWRCSRPAAVRRPRRSVRRRVCAKPTGCSRSIGNSVHSSCAGSRPHRWPRCGAASGTAGWSSPGTAWLPSRSRSALTACMRSAPPWRPSDWGRTRSR